MVNAAWRGQGGRGWKRLRRIGIRVAIPEELRDVEVIRHHLLSLRTIVPRAGRGSLALGTWFFLIVRHEIGTGSWGQIMACFFATHRLSVRDYISPQAVRLVLFVLVCSAFDALFTLIHIEHGGSEANPIMAMAIGYGPAQFVRAKMGLTGLGAILLASYERRWLGSLCLYLTATLYAAILLYHALLYFNRF